MREQISLDVLLTSACAVVLVHTVADILTRTTVGQICWMVTNFAPSRRRGSQKCYWTSVGAQIAGIVVFLKKTLYNFD
jgi:hypothetical protein